MKTLRLHTWWRNVTLMKRSCSIWAKTTLFFLKKNYIKTFKFVSLFMFLLEYVCLSFSIEKVPLDKALNLSLYLSKESEIMPVTQGFNELVPLYKLMEKRNMEELENKMKVMVKRMITCNVLDVKISQFRHHISNLWFGWINQSTINH